jgi:hypothetical protein
LGKEKSGNPATNKYAKHFFTVYLHLFLPLNGSSSGALVQNNNVKKADKACPRFLKLIFAKMASLDMSNILPMYVVDTNSFYWFWPTLLKE